MDNNLKWAMEQLAFWWPRWVLGAAEQRQAQADELRRRV